MAEVITFGEAMVRLSPPGFRRLEQEGAWFQNCHYPYAHTVTAAGHASILTGCSPDKHAIVGNEWFDGIAPVL